MLYIVVKVRYYVVSGRDMHGERHKKLIERYTLFKYIQNDMLFDIEHKNYYDYSAYHTKANKNTSALS